MIANKILETKLINQYNKMYDNFAQNNTLKLNLSEDNIIVGLIQDVKAKNVNSTYKKEILTNYGVLKTGDYITHVVNGKTTNYIVESQIDNEIGCDKAYLLETPLSINIFDWNYSDIKTYPIALKNNNASLGVTEGAVSITANSSFDIIMKYDEHTRSFISSTNVINGIEHSMITRILLDGMAFERIAVNHLINKGLLILSIETTNITPADNLDLQVADYTTYYREPIDYNGLIDAEILKYETTATITKDILSNADVTSIIKKLKTGKTANNNITVSVSNVDADGLLTLNAGVVRLKNQIAYEDLDNTTTATLTFTYGGVSKTLLVNVTIQKQDKIITDEDIVVAEMPKYETTATITKDIIAETDVTSTIIKLKDGQTANEEVTVTATYVGEDNLLTLTDGVITLTDQIAYEATDNETTVNITFTYGTGTKTISVFVTIEKQDEQSAPPDLVITGEYYDMYNGDTNDYSINTDLPVIWTLRGENASKFTLNTTGTSNTCSVTALSGVKQGINVTLVATVNGEFEYTVEIIGLSY